MMHTLSEHPGPSSGLGPSGLGPSGLGPSGLGASGLGASSLASASIGAASMGSSSLAASMGSSSLAASMGSSSLAASTLGAPTMPSVLSFAEGMNLYEPQQRQRFIFKMPRVVPEQKAKFESEELFRRLSRESEVKYTGYRDRPLEERQVRFTNGCREGHTEIAFTGTGTNLQLVFGPTSGFSGDPRQCDFDKEHGKVHLRSPLIMNGVCVAWRGWIDLDRLDGVGCLEYDEERANEEDAILREQLERYNRRVQEFEEKQRAYRSGNVAIQPPHIAPHHHHHHHHHHHGHHQHHPIPGTSTITHDPHLTHHRQDSEMRAY